MRNYSEQLAKVVEQIGQKKARGLLKANHLPTLWSNAPIEIKDKQNCYQTISLEELNSQNQLRKVFKNGELLIDESFAAIRKRVSMI